MGNYPTWFIAAMNELESDLDEGIISYDTYITLLQDLEEELDEYQG